MFVGTPDEIRYGAGTHETLQRVARIERASNYYYLRDISLSKGRLLVATMAQGVLQLKDLPPPM